MSITSPTGTPDSQKPVAQGRLEDRPFPRLLHQLFGKKVTGCLRMIDDSEDESRVYLRDGAPVHVTRPNDIDRLDLVIAESGLVPSHVLSDLSESLPPGRRLGEVLIERGLIGAPALADALKLQMRRKLLRLFFPLRGEFSIFLDPHNFGAGDEYKEMRVDPRCLMYPGVRAAYDESRLRAELAPLANHRFRILPTLAGSLLEAMGFKTTDSLIAALGERPHTLADLPPGGPKAMEAWAIVLALLYTDLLETTPVSPAGISTPATARAMPAVGSGPVRAMPAVGSGPVRAMPAVGSGPVAVSATGDSGRAPAMTKTGSHTAAGNNATRPGSPAASPAGSADSESSRTGKYLAVGGGTERVGAKTNAPVLPRQMPAPPTPPSSSSSSLPAVTGSGPYVSAGAASAVPLAVASPSGSGPMSSGASGPILPRLEDLVGRLGTISHFELLGVGESASNDEINAAYLRSMKQYHPDRLAGLGMRDSVDKAARLVAQMNDAHSALMDPKRRAEYLANRGLAPPAVDSGRAIIAAEEAFQRGEVLLKNGDHVKALEAFSQAMKANPIEPIYKAYWAWARWDSPGAAKDRLVRDTLKVLEDVMRDRTRFPIGLYWTGLLHKHLGDGRNAEKAFQAAVEQDKDLLEAERELRLIEMRRVRATASHQAVGAKPASSAARKGGLLDKLRKR